jgi:hypothetical protein
MPKHTRRQAEICEGGEQSRARLTETEGTGLTSWRPRRRLSLLRQTKEANDRKEEEQGRANAGPYLENPNSFGRPIGRPGVNTKKLLCFVLVPNRW